MQHADDLADHSEPCAGHLQPVVERVEHLRADFFTGDGVDVRERLEQCLAPPSGSPSHGCLLETHRLVPL